MNEESTAQALTKDDFMQAVALAGGPKAVQAAFDGLRLANDQLDKEYSRILEQYPRHWIAMGPDGMIANVPVPEDSTEEDEEQALERLFELIGDSGSNRNGYLNQYQSGMCISGVLKTTEMTTRLLASPLGPKRGATDSPV